MTTKKKAPPKKKIVKKKTAPKKKVVKKQAVKKKPIVKKKAPAKKKAVPKRRARSVRLGPVPKLHVNHTEWDKIAVMDVICDTLMNSSKGIVYICRDNKDLPNASTVFRWFQEEEKNGADKPCCDMYTRAKLLQIDCLVDEGIEIADNEVGSPVVIDGVPVVVKGEIIKVIDGPAVQHAKLRSDNRHFVAKTLGHRKYGPKLELSNDPERPLSTLTDEQLETRRKQLEEKLAEHGAD